MSGFLMTKAGTYGALHAAILLYSVSSVVAKLASAHSFRSWHFWGLVALEVLVLAIYAIFWQQMLKRLPLTTAYANRAMAIIWTFIAGLLFFGESFRWQNLAGMALLIGGIYLVVTSDGQQNTGDRDNSIHRPVSGNIADPVENERG
jgi:drug/metabolite transporter (DMT)-like permease